jgi:hypothetical protein
MRTLLLVLVSVVGVSLLGHAQAPAERPAEWPEGKPFFPPLAGEYTPTTPDEIVKGPVPRLHDGKPDLSGPWVGGGSNQDIERDGGLKPDELPLLPWAKALRDSRNERDEPYVFCTPMSIPRSNPYPWRFVHSFTAKGPTHIFVLHENGDAGASRQIFMDGRKHPTNLIPTWWGHSIGRWDGDTLEIDTIGFNDKFWFDSRGTPHTEQLHTVERWTRVNYGTMTNDFTLDDPGAFSRPVQLKFTAKVMPPGEELMEMICTENNQYGVSIGLTNPLLQK